MSWQQRLAPVAVVAAIAAGCSGGGDQPAQEQAAETSTTTISETTSTAEITEVPDEPVASTSSTTPQRDVGAPESLAFSSTSDLGRLFEIEGSLRPAESAGSDVFGDTLANGTLVQAANLRSRDGDVWVLVYDTEQSSSPLGWVLADELRPTTQSVEWVDQDTVSQLRQVSRVVEDDMLAIFATPGGNTTNGSLMENQVAVHGGTTVLLSSGVTMVDVINPENGGRLGWVDEDDFSPIASGVIQTDDGGDAGRRADRDVSYGAQIGRASVAIAGCNAAQIEVTNSSSTRGLALVFGTSAPTGRALNSSDGHLWSASGGTTVYADPGRSILLTVTTRSDATWHFMSLDDDGEPVSGVSGTDVEGNATANGVQTVDVAFSSCGTPVIEEGPPSTEDPTTGTETPADGEADAGASGSADEFGNGTESSEDLETAPTVGIVTVPTESGDTVPPTASGDTVPPSA